MTVEHHVAQSLTVPMFAYRDAGGSGEQAAEACALRLLRVASDGAALRSGSKLSSTASDDMLWTVMVARAVGRSTPHQNVIPKRKMFEC